MDYRRLLIAPKNNIELTGSLLLPFIDFSVHSLEELGCFSLVREIETHHEFL
jgi:hypothetical protein